MGYEGAENTSGWRSSAMSVENLDWSDIIRVELDVPKVSCKLVG